MMDFLYLMFLSNRRDYFNTFVNIRSILLEFGLLFFGEILDGMFLLRGNEVD